MSKSDPSLLAIAKITSLLDAHFAANQTFLSRAKVIMCDLADEITERSIERSHKQTQKSKKRARKKKKKDKDKDGDKDVYNVSSDPEENRESKKRKEKSWIDFSQADFGLKDDREKLKKTPMDAIKLSKSIRSGTYKFYADDPKERKFYDNPNIESLENDALVSLMMEFFYCAGVNAPPFRYSSFFTNDPTSRHSSCPPSITRTGQRVGTCKHCIKYIELLKLGELDQNKDHPCIFDPVSAAFYDETQPTKIKHPLMWASLVKLYKGNNEKYANEFNPKYQKASVPTTTTIEEIPDSDLSEVDSSSDEELVDELTPPLTRRKVVTRTVSPVASTSKN